ncbi:hypothetical protein DYB32_005848 [Aphanomyces invadans]|uniref:Uncharacterized protein n=1 Tax=Aphanomyces invadans TaxID=157072 RepID=A0A418ATC1_9STRA|nr:hypothetical protein DYB32_005848 [Aphanomyces invadans]
MANKTSAASGLRLDAAVGRNLAIDVVAAGAASFFVAPFITTVDRAIIENASGKRVLSTALQEISLDFLRNPLSFIRRKEFLLIYGLYTATYLSANAIDTVCEATEHDNKLPKFVGTTAVNMGLCIAKDREFARMFGVIAPAKFPLVSVALFAVRDSMTVGASFVAPPVIASFIESNGFANKSNSNSLAQMLCPAIESPVIATSGIVEAAPTAAISGDFTVAKKLAIDLIAASTASLFVSPIITTIDRAIMENASGKRVLAQGLREISLDFVRNPISFIKRKDFLLIYSLYIATYGTANVIDTVSEYAQTDGRAAKFVGTTAVNVTLCVAKDREFARMFGVIAPTKFPIVSLGLFAARDALSVGATFIAPPIISKYFEKAGMDKTAASSTALLMCPSLVRVLHSVRSIILDIYNHRESTFKNRAAFVSREYIRSATARISRTIPAFGLGGIGNKHLRENLTAKLL